MLDQLTSIGVVAPNKSIPLFDRAHHSFVPTASDQAVARSGGPGRPSGRRLGALPWTAASTMAGLACIGRKAILAVMVASLMLSVGGNASAAPMRRSRVQLHSFESYNIANYVDDAAHHFAIPAAWIRAVMHVESHGDRRAVSPKGAMGLMQLMPDTWADLRYRYDLGRDPYDLHDNIYAGAAYLREMYDQYGSPGFLAAYNAGPKRYEAYRYHGHRLPSETMNYVAMLAPAVVGSKAGALPPDATSGPSWFKAMLSALGDRPHSDDGQPATPAQPKAPRRSRPPVDLTAITPQSTGLFVPISATDKLR